MKIILMMIFMFNKKIISDVYDSHLLDYTDWNIPYMKRLL